MKDQAKLRDRALSGMLGRHSLRDECQAKGLYTFKLFDAHGNVINEGKFKNLLVTVGMNELLNDALRSTTSYTTTGPFCGLISSASFTAVAVGDTMASHAGWLEAGVANAPTYSATRPTSAFAAASGGAISFSSAASFTFTGASTGSGIPGAFVVFGAGATSGVANTGGSLLSVGTFGTAQPVISGNVLTVSYTLTL
jgi:hypothetical protein